MSYDLDEAEDAFYAAGGWRTRSRAVLRPQQLGEDEIESHDRGQQILERLAQERSALNDALARNALARARVERQQEQKLKMGEDVFEDGDVIRWVKRFRNADGSLSQQSYTYAAVKAGGKWYTTGSLAKTGAAHGRTWAGLLAFMIARGEVESADIMEPIPGRKLV